MDSHNQTSRSKVFSPKTQIRFRTERFGGSCEECDRETVVTPRHANPKQSTWPISATVEGIFLRRRTYCQRSTLVSLPRCADSLCNVSCIGFFFFFLARWNWRQLRAGINKYTEKLLLGPTLDIHYRACVGILGNSDVVYRKSITLSCRSREAIHVLKESDDSKSTWPSPQR